MRSGGCYCFISRGVYVLGAVLGSVFFSRGVSNYGLLWSLRFAKRGSFFRRLKREYGDGVWSFAN